MPMSQLSPAPAAAGPVVFNPASGELRVGASVTVLRPRTAGVLAALMARPDCLMSKEALLAAVWPDTVVTEDSLVQCIKEIRRALGPAAVRVRTIPRRGYLFVAAGAPAGEAADDAPGPLAGDAADDAGGGSSDAAIHDAAPPAPPAPSRLRRALAAATFVLVAAAGAGTWRATRPAAGRSTRLVVRPFAGAGDPPPPDWFVEGLTGDLTDDLARLPGVAVIAHSTARALPLRAAAAQALARELGVSHVVEGSASLDGDEVTVTVRLIDAASGTQRWSERIAAARRELAAIQRRVASRIARALEIELVDAELWRAASGLSELPRAHELTLQGWASLNRGARAEVERARRLFEEALALDDRQASAWIGLSHCHTTAYTLRWSTDPAAELRQAASAVARATTLAPRQLYVRGTAGVLLALQGRMDEARALLQSEVADYPSNAAAHYWLGIAQLYLADPAAAAASLQRAIELSPHDRSASGFHRVLATALLHLGDSAAAVRAARRAVGFVQPHRLAYATLAAALQTDGQADAARLAMAEFLRRNPGFTLAGFRAEEMARSPQWQHMRQPLYRALLDSGLPPG